MEYLVTGSKGFIGRNLVRYFADQRIPFFTDLDEWIADTLIHLSAMTNVRESVKYPDDTFDRNSESTFDRLRHAYRRDFKKFIFTSSIGAANPLNPYLASKACGEAYCKAFKESYGLDTKILRLSNVYGPRSEYKNSVIPKFIKAAIAGEPFFIYGDGDQTRDFIYVDDVVNVILNA